MSAVSGAEVFAFEGFSLDPRARRLFGPDGRSLPLTGRAFDTLLYLVEHPNQLIDKQALMKAVWPNVIVEENNLNQNILIVRRALGETPGEHRFIVTVPRRGFRFVPVVRRLEGAGEHVSDTRARSKATETRLAPIGANANVREPAAHFRPPRLRAPTLASALAAAALLTGGYALWHERSGASVASAHVKAPSLSGALENVARTGATALPSPPYSIAVLPFLNLSSDKEQEYFSDGLSEDLITALSKFPGLRVIGRHSSFQFRDSKENSKTVGQRLHVAYLLEGSVRRAGDVVRISAELVDTSDGSTHWSERYDRPYKDLFALQDDITRAVAGTLKTHLLSRESASLQSERPPGGSLDAYNALLQGRFYFSRGTEADYRKAIEFFTQATQLDPRYAFAWSGLSNAWTWLGTNFLGGVSAQEAYAKAREAVDRALALSPELPTAHVVRGHVLRADFDWRGAGAEYRRALELAPNDAEAKFYVARHLATFGEVEPAIHLARQVITAEPLRADWYDWLAIYLSAAIRLDEAEQAIHRAIELQPNAAGYHWDLAYIEVQRGDAQAALAAAEQESSGLWQDSALALALQVGGDRHAANAALRMLINKHAGIAALRIAEVYAVREDATETFEWLDRAWSNREPSIAGLRFDPFILRYKDDPRFETFCRTIGLPVPGEASARKAP
jgi:TolB-like protein/DNA-binding winged helix-turn-helix (wHTH) protein/Tfp pilus assembly protein PilF